MQINSQIEMRQKNKILLWSIYFDLNKSRRAGRRVPKKLAVSSPKLEELERAAKRLGLETETVSDAAYPTSPWLKTGLILLPRNESKNTTLKKIGEQLSILRR